MRTRTFAKVLLLLIPALASASCGFFGERDAPPSAETDSLAGGVSSAVEDSLPAVAEGGEPQVEQEGPEPRAERELDSLGAVRPSAETTDTLLPSLAEVSARIQRLEEENDSLRIALRTLLPLLSSERPTSAEASQEAAAEEEIIPVDTEQVRNWGFRTLVAILILLLTGYIVRLLAWTLEKLAERNAKRRLTFKRLVPVLRILIWAFTAFFVVRIVFGVGGQQLLAAGAAIGVAIGFAAQDILKNVFGGLILLFDQPFQVGDKISVGGTYGEVVAIGLRSTRITTPDDNLVTVPNAQVVDGQVANANAGELNCQVVTDLYLPGWVDEAAAKKIAFDAAASSKYVYLNKPIVVLVKDKFEDTFLTHLKVKAYVLDPRYEFQFMSDVTERARKGFRAAGLLGPMHGVRAYVDLDRFPEVVGPEPQIAEGDEEAGS